jgi:hypothetical protein
MNTTITNWLFRPFERLSEFKALWIGLTAILLSGMLNFYGQTHFDGVLDVHLQGLETRISVFICEGLIDWLTLSLLFFAGGLLFSKSAIRLIDVAGTQAMARWPLLIGSFAALLIPHEHVIHYLLSKAFQTGTETVPDVLGYEYILFGLLTIIVLATIIWMILLMFRGFSIACNLKGNKATALFIVILLLAEGLSKYLISLVCKFI